MDVPNRIEFQQLQSQVDDLKRLVHQLSESPLYLEWVTLKQACELLKIKQYQTVSKMCKSGKLVYQQPGRVIQVHYGSIIKYKNSQVIK